MTIILLVQATRMVVLILRVIAIMTMALLELRKWCDWFQVCHILSEQMDVS